MIKSLAILVLAASLIAPVADAATKTPTPTPKATSIKKAVVKKKVVLKKKAPTKLSPSPSPAWPPAGFKSNGEAFAKLPTAKELVSSASNDLALTGLLAQLVDGVRICEKYSCGAVQIASLNGCTWWEVNAKLVGEVSPGEKVLKTFGTIRALVKQTAPKEIVTVLLISQEPLERHHIVTGISANCHHDASSEKIPSSTYTSLNN